MSDLAYKVFARTKSTGSTLLPLKAYTPLPRGVFSFLTYTPPTLPQHTYLKGTFADPKWLPVSLPKRHM